MTYKLARTLPDGTVKAWSTPFPTMRKAAQAVAYCLADNGLDTQAGANAFASRFQDAAPGTAMLHEASGYTFTSEPAAESILADQVRGATWADDIMSALHAAAPGDRAELLNLRGLAMLRKVARQCDVPCAATLKTKRDAIEAITANF